MTGDIGPEDAALRALADLIGSGGWRPHPGPPGALVYLLPWPDGTVDTLAVKGATQALAERTNPIGHPVWRHVGAVVEVIAQVRALPSPNGPDAPRLVIGDGTDRGGQRAMTGHTAPGGAAPLPQDETTGRVRATDDFCPHAVSATENESAPVSAVRCLDCGIRLGTSYRCDNDTWQPIL